MNWRLQIVGPTEIAYGGGGERYLRQLQALAEPISDSIDWMGAIFDSERLGEVYGGARLFVYPSLAEKGETFGLAPLEAMSFGCVPIVSNLECFRDYVENGVCGIAFDHTGPEPERVLASELGKAMIDDVRGAKLSTLAIARAESFTF